MEFNSPEKSGEEIYPIRDVNRVIDALTKKRSRPSDDSLSEPKITDIEGGVGGTADVNVEKDIFVIYGGINRRYNLRVENPNTAVITYGGVRNNYRVYSTGGKILFITYGGTDNQHVGGRRTTFEQFKKEFAKQS